MNIGSLTGQITLDDQLSTVLSGISKRLSEFESAVTSSMGSAAKSMKIAATVGSFLGNVFADLGMRGFAWAKNLVTSSLMAGARLEQLGVATRFLGEKAGYSGPYIDDLAKKIQATGISGISTRESILQLLGANIDLTNAAKLSAIAQNMQSLSGKSSSEVFQVMTRAIATGNTELLRNIGFQNISIEGLKRQTKETTGYTGVLSGAQRSSMIMNAIMVEGAQKAGLYGESMKTAGKQASSAERAWSEVSEQIGTALLPITNVAIKSWYALGQAVRDSVMKSQGSVAVAMESIASGLQSVITLTGKFVTALVDAFIQATPYIVSAWSAMRDLFSFLSSHIETIKTATIAVTAFGVAWKTLQIGGTIVTGVIAGLTRIGIVATGLQTGALIGLVTPIGAIALAIGGLAAAVYLFHQRMNSLHADNKAGQYFGTVAEQAELARKKLEEKGPLVSGADTLKIPSSSLTGSGKGAMEKFAADALATAKKTGPLKIGAKIVFGDSAATATEEAMATARAQKRALEEAEAERLALINSTEYKKAAKEFADAWKIYREFGSSAGAVVDSMNQSTVEGIKYDLQRGVSQAILAKSYGATERQVQAIFEVEKLQKGNEQFLREMWNEEGIAKMNRDALFVASDREMWNEIGIGQMNAAAERMTVDKQAAEHQRSLWNDVGVAQMDAAAAAMHAWDGLKGTLSSIPGILMDAFTGGGDLLGAAKAIGVSIADSIVKGIREKMKGMGKTISEGVATAIGIGAAGAGALGYAAGLNSTTTALIGMGTAAAGTALAASGMFAATTAGTIALGAATLGIGAAAVGVAFLVKKYFFVSKAIKEARAASLDFEKQIWETLTPMQAVEAQGEAWRATLISVRDTYLKLGRSAVDAERDVAAMWDTDHPEIARAAIDRINAAYTEMRLKIEAVDHALDGLIGVIDDIGTGLPNALRPLVQQLLDMPNITDAARLALGQLLDNGPNFKKLQQEAEGFGITLEQLGPKFQQASVTETSGGLISLFERLVDAGADAGGVLAGMSDEISEVVNNSMKFGSVLPSNMRSMIEVLAESGQLLDENGDAIRDISDLRFGDPVKTDVEKIEDAIRLLAEAIERIPVALALIPTSIPDPFRDWDTDREPQTGGGSGSRNRDYEGPDHAATGGFVTASGITPFARGTDTIPAMLTPGETVLPAKTSVGSIASDLLAGMLEAISQVVSDAMKSFSALQGVERAPSKEIERIREIDNFIKFDLILPANMLSMISGPAFHPTSVSLSPNAAPVEALAASGKETARTGAPALNGTSSTMVESTTTTNTTLRDVSGLQFGDLANVEKIENAIRQLVEEIERIPGILATIPNQLPDPFRNWDTDLYTDDSKPAYAASGGIVTANGITPFARGTDTIWAMLTPGETVLPVGSNKVLSDSAKFGTKREYSARDVTPEVAGRAYQGLTTEGARMSNEDLSLAAKGPTTSTYQINEALDVGGAISDGMGAERKYAARGGVVTTSDDQILSDSTKFGTKQEYAASGGVVTTSGITPFARGTDTIPSMLTPGETVLPVGGDKVLSDSVKFGRRPEYAKFGTRYMNHALPSAVTDTAGIQSELNVSGDTNRGAVSTFTSGRNGSVIADERDYDTVLSQNKRSRIEGLAESRQLSNENGESFADLSTPRFDNPIDRIQNEFSGPFRSWDTDREPQIGDHNTQEYTAIGDVMASSGMTPFAREADNVPTMGMPGETVHPLGASAGGGGTVIINVEGRMLAEIAVPHIPGVIKRYGLGRQ